MSPSAVIAGPVLDTITSDASAKLQAYLPGLPPKGANKPVELKPSPEEIAQGRFSDANIKLLLSAMHRDGMVIIKDVINPAHLDKINEFMVKDTEVQLKKEGLHHNFNVENIQQGPPLYQEHFYDDVYLNKLLFHAVTLYLGPDAGFNLVSGNNALANGVKRQPVHADAMSAHPDCPYYVVANVYTVDTEPANGATELWLGTHHYNIEAQCPANARGATQITQEYLDAHTKSGRPGFQPTVKRGSILLRDMRLWHAGMPNHTDAQRYMIALGFAANWWHGKARFRVPAGTGVYDRFMHGMKGTGVNPWMAEISQEEYDELRDAADFTGREKVTFDGEKF